MTCTDLKRERLSILIGGGGALPVDTLDLGAVWSSRSGMSVRHGCRFDQSHSKDLQDNKRDDAYDCS